MHVGRSTEKMIVLLVFGFQDIGEMEDIRLHPLVCKYELEKQWVRPIWIIYFLKYPC